MSAIEQIETYVDGRTCVVRVVTDEGQEGFGQAAPGQLGISAEVLHGLVAPHFLGKDPWDLGALVDACMRAEYKFLGTFLLRALGGVDTAIWDLLGKATNQPVYPCSGEGPQEDPRLCLQHEPGDRGAPGGRAPARAHRHLRVSVRED